MSDYFGDTGNWNGFVSTGMLYYLKKHFPKFAFSAGIDPSTKRYCVFVYTHVGRWTSIPDAGSQIAAIETEGGSKESFEVLCAKIALLHG